MLTTKELRCRRSLDNFDQIITMLAGMASRFATALDCADTGFLPDGVLGLQPHRQHFVDGMNASGYVPSGTSPGRNGPFGAVRLTRDAPEPYGQRGG